MSGFPGGGLPPDRIEDRLRMHGPDAAPVRDLSIQHT